MTNVLRTGFRGACVAIALACAAPASATSFSTNYSDLWWNPAESGWGLNVTQQADVMFITLFVYGPQNQPIWYSATLRYAGEGVNGNKSWTGDLYQTNGPYFQGPFDPAQVVLTKVGAATFASNASTTAVFQYIVGSAAVIKNVQRQTLVTDNLSGSYLGATSDVTNGCRASNLNGFRTEDAGNITVTQAGNALTIQAPTCRFTGQYGQDGQVGSMGGTYTCTTGASGTISFTDLRVETTGLVGRYTGQDANCSFAGNIGALRKP